MPTEPNRNPPSQDDATAREDEPMPSASEERVLDETARMTREGRKEREADPREPRPPRE